MSQAASAASPGDQVMKKLPREETATYSPAALREMLEKEPS